VAMCDWSKRTAMTKELKQYAKRIGVPYFESISAMCGETRFEAAGILAPPSAIPGVVKEIGGKAAFVLLEKPAAKNLAGAREIHATAKRHKMKLSIAYPTRNFVQLECLKKAVDEGGIGKPLSGVYTYLQTNGPLYTVKTTKSNLALVAGGDDTMFLGYGVLDMEWVAGSRIETVHAIGGAFFYPNYKRAGINDLTHVTFKMQNGFGGSITVGRITAKNRPAIHSVDVTGTTGAASADFAKDRMTVSDAASMRYSLVPQTAPVSLVENFIHSSLENKEAQYTADDVFHTVAVQEAVRISMARGRAVTVPTI